MRLMCRFFQLRILTVAYLLSELYITLYNFFHHKVTETQANKASFD
jgi:hypothetical protein